VADFKELRRKTLIHENAFLSLGLSNLALFPQLSKESEQLPKDFGMTITFSLDSKESNCSLLLLLSEYQIPVLII
jgi:ribosomal protein L5